MKKVVITGPTGTIGIALIEKCIKENIEVLAICRENSSTVNNIPMSKLVTIIECDISSYSTLQIEGKYDVFYHFAWAGTIGDSRNDLFLQNKNVQYTLDAVNLAKKLGCSVFIGAGSQAEYGRVYGKISPDTITLPENGYGVAKLCAGQMSRILCEQLAMKHIWIRVFSVYGPHDDENTLITSTIKKILRGESPQFTKGEQIWDFLYSGDAANAFYLAAYKGVDKRTYCLGSGAAKPLKEYISIIQSLINPSLILKFGAIPYAKNQVMYLFADIETLKMDTGFYPNKDFKSGVMEILEIEMQKLSKR